MNGDVESGDRRATATVSVVVPSYNAERFLPEAIASVRAQTRPALELIVIDDCSSDGSLDVARRLGATCLSTPAHAGPSAARNVGIRAARGALVAFLDADDLWEPDHLARTVELLERFPSAAVAFGGVRQFTYDVDLRNVAGPPLHRAGAPLGAPADIFWTLLHENLLSQSAAVARRDALIEAGCYDESMHYAEDYDLWLRVALRAPFVGTPSVTTNYRVHSAQSSRSAPRMAQGWWTARAHARAIVAATQPPQALERLDVVMRQAWEADLREAWRTADRARIETVLALHDSVPGAATLRSRWERRVRRFWPMWAPAALVWDRLPRSLRAALKAPRRLLRADG